MWKERSWHDRGVIIRTWIVVIIMLTSGCLLDSEDWGLFLMIMILGAIYLTVFSIVNYDRWQ